MPRLAAPQRNPAGIGTLTNGLVAAWSFLDAAHLGLEAQEVYNMNVQGGPTSSAGPSTNIPLASHFTSGTQNIMYIPSGDVRIHAFTPGSGSFTLALWANLDDATVDHMIFAHGRTVSVFNSNIEYYFIAQGSSHQYKLQLFGDAGSNVAPQASTPGTASGTAKWTFCLSWVDMNSTPPRAFIQYDNGKVVTGGIIAPSGVWATTNETVSIGSWFNQTGATQSKMAGSIAGINYWSRVLNTVERTAMYNHTLGLLYPFNQRLLGGNRQAAPPRLPVP